MMRPPIPPGGTTSDACQPLVNVAAITGNIALVDRGARGFAWSRRDAHNAGAAAVVVANAAANGEALGTMAGVDQTITISSILVGFSTGGKLKSELGNGAST